MPLYNRTLRVPDGQAGCYPECPEGYEDIYEGMDVYGCDDPTACNYFSQATINDGSCFYQEQVGCSNPMADNYDEYALGGTGLCTDLCTYHAGCTDQEAENWDEQANYAYNVLGMVEMNAPEMCVYAEEEVVEGCTNTDAENFNELANVNDGSCVFSEDFYNSGDDDEDLGNTFSKFLEDNKTLLIVLAVGVAGYVIYKNR